VTAQSTISRSIVSLLTLGLALAACEVVQTSQAEQPGITMQGITMQGITMQGITMQGMSLHGFRLAGASLSGSGLHDVHVERGELVAALGSTTLRGTALIGAHLRAQVKQLGATPPSTAVAEFRITAIVPELAQYDPTDTGNTYLYTLEQWVEDSGSWQAACPVDPTADPPRSRWPRSGTSTVIAACPTRSSRSAVPRA